MPHVITHRCVGIKDQSCVDVCPVDCIHPASELDGRTAFDAAPQLYIDPAICIDCGACVPVCPVEAIFMIEELPGEYTAAIEENRRFYETPSDTRAPGSGGEPPHSSVLRPLP